MERFPSIDLLRGLAIVLMVQVHFTDNLSSRDGNSPWLYDWSSILGALAAPLFAFLSGVSFRLWVRRQEADRRKEREITRIAVRRGFFLFLLGIAFNICIWLPEEAFNWDILTLLGTALLFLAYVRRLPAPVLALIAVLVLLISPIARLVGDFPAYWVDYEYVYDPTPRDILFGFVANGYFPLFPWLAFPIVGYLVADKVFPRRGLVERPHQCAAGFGLALLALSVLACALAGTSTSSVVRSYADGLTEFPASTGYVLGTLGAAILALLLMHRWVDGREGSGNVAFRYLERCGTYPLTIYVLHHAVILWPLWIYGAATGHADSTVYWRHAMGTPLAFALGIAFLLACHFLMAWLETRRRFTLESLMRRLSG